MHNLNYTLFYDRYLEQLTEVDMNENISYIIQNIFKVVVLSK